MSFRPEASRVSDTLFECDRSESVSRLPTESRSSKNLEKCPRFCRCRSPPKGHNPAVHGITAEVAELVDAQDLGSCTFGCRGSSPLFRIASPGARARDNDVPGGLASTRERAPRDEDPPEPTRGWIAIHSLFRVWAIRSTWSRSSLMSPRSVRVYARAGTAAPRCSDLGRPGDLREAHSEVYLRALRRTVERLPAAPAFVNGTAVRPRQPKTAPSPH